jgi:hypothetical protein
MRTPSCMKRTYTCVPDAIHTLHNAWSVPGANVHVRFCREGGEKQRIGCLAKTVLGPLREEAFLADPLVQLGQVIVIVEVERHLTTDPAGQVDGVR